MALTNSPAQPNKILRKFGSINSWEPNWSPNPLAGNSVNIGLAARSLICKLDGDLATHVKAIDYSWLIHSISGGQTQAQPIGRLAVFRNYTGALDPMIFDPLFNADSTTGTFSGINWQTSAGVTIPIFNWNDPEILLLRWVGGANRGNVDQIPVDFKLENDTQNIVIVLTPMYGDQQPSSTGAVNDFTGIHTFLGSQPPTGSNAENTFVFRSLSVLGKYGNCDC